MESMTFQELTNRLVQLYQEGKFEEAYNMIEQDADRFPDQSARTIFWKMCLLSLAGRSEEVISTFRQGLQSGLWWHETVLADSDLDAVRELPAFQALVSESQKMCMQARTHIDREYSVIVPEAPTTSRYPLIITLHGRNANKDIHLPPWQAAQRCGWLVLAAQSTQALFRGAYCWDDPQQSVADLLFYLEKVSQEYSIDPQRVLIAGFSQGSGMALHTALSGAITVQGFIGIASYWEDPNTLPQPAGEARHLRGYFVTGEKDHTLENAKEIRRALQARNIPYEEEKHPELAHDFPADFESSFNRAIDFIFKEHE